MTDAIKSLGKVMQTLRRQLAKPADAGKSPGTGVTTPVSGATAGASNSLQGRTRARLAALDPDDPAFHRKARRAFLQVVLAEEFGNAVVEDPAFFRLLEALEQTIDADEPLSTAFDELTRRLRDTAGS